MHNIQPVGKMWSVEAFDLARKAQYFVHSACLFHKEMGKTGEMGEKQLSFGPWIIKKNILARLEI